MTPGAGSTVGAGSTRGVGSYRVVVYAHFRTWQAALVCLLFVGFTFCAVHAEFDLLLLTPWWDAAYGILAVVFVWFTIAMVGTYRLSKQDVSVVPDAGRQVMTIANGPFVGEWAAKRRTKVPSRVPYQIFFVMAGLMWILTFAYVYLWFSRGPVEPWQYFVVEYPFLSVTFTLNAFRMRQVKDLRYSTLVRRSGRWLWLYSRDPLVGD